MKKDYVKPNVKVIFIEGCENIVHTSSSYVGIGGTTDRFNSPRRDYSEIWDDFEDE